MRNKKEQDRERAKWGNSNYLRGTKASGSVEQVVNWLSPYKQRYLPFRASNVVLLQQFVASRQQSALVWEFNLQVASPSQHYNINYY